MWRVYWYWFIYFMHIITFCFKTNCHVIHIRVFEVNVRTYDACRAVGMSENPGGGANNNVVGIISPPPNWERVNWTISLRGGRAPSPHRFLRLQQPWHEMNDIKPQLQYYRIPFEWKFKPINFSTLSPCWFILDFRKIKLEKSPQLSGFFQKSSTDG